MPGGMKVAAQGVHLDQRGQVAGVAEIVSEAALGQAGAGGRFDGDDARLALALHLAAHVGHRQAGKVRSAAGAGDDHVRLVAGQRHLLDGFQADDRLVQQHVIEHAAQRVLGVGVLGGHFHGLGDGDAQRAVGVRMRGENGAARLGLRAGAGGDRGAEGLHQRAAIGLLVVADAHHVDLAIQAEEGAGHGQRRAPLAGAGLGGEVLGAVLLVVIGLRDGGVRACASRPGCTPSYL